MKTEFLKSQGLTDEQITAIMAENGKDIVREQTKVGQATEKLQAELDNSKLETKSMSEQLANVNSEMEKFKTMDVDSIKNKVTELEGKNKEYETQLATSKEAYEKQLADQQYDFKVNEYVSGQKFTSEFTKKAYMTELKAQGFKLAEDGTLLGANEYTEKFKTENQGVFIVEAPVDEKPIPEFTKQQGEQLQDKSGMFNFGFNPLRPVPKE